MGNEHNGPQLRRCSLTTEADIRALAEFAQSPHKTEEQLQRLLEQHTGIVGALGFCEFFSEYPVYKRDENAVLLKKGRRDRIDILAAQDAEVLDTSGSPYKSTHVIELKNAHGRLLDRPEGLRLSPAATEAMRQLKNYTEWLTTVEENRQALRDVGWTVVRPAMHLIMGSEQEFAERPGLLDALRQECVQEFGARLWLIEDLLKQADRMRLVQYASMECVLNLKAPRIPLQPLIVASSGLAGLVMRARQLLDEKRSVYGNIVLRDGLSEGLVHIPGNRLQPLARRIGVPFAEAVIDFSQYRRMWKPVTDGIVVSLPDVAAVQQAIELRELRNTSKVRERRRQWRALREAVYTRQFANRIRQRFPSLPKDEEFEIAARATEVGSRRVGRARRVDDPIVLAVGAHARWRYTDYGDILEETHEEYRQLRGSERRYLPPPAEEAKRAVSQLVREMLQLWSKPATAANVE